ncbi:DUF3306 domain-containing protein [Polynucleobacter sp. 73C-SIWE]|uniref:DUF3306 domain-containing protein n=1 Tax=Polynucleobacter sp. 73C-SIWE TaxID=2689098 RepID=UPI001C20E752|nr:DUF3306 domain-containing protein [Polynucleobacter sp. 73C-SIWE]
MAEGFLSRWSKRKAGKSDDPVEQPKEVAKSPAPVSPEEPAPPPVTLEDVEKIDRFDPDFSAFMKPDVDPAVQQAALKKMFTDPHFNVMDGLDIYIDDYSKPDPLPPGMLERMVQSDMLGLFSKPDATAEEEKQAEEQIASSQANEKLLEAQDQTDLTSTDSTAQTKSAHLDEVPIEPAQKKT